MSGMSLPPLKPEHWKVDTHTHQPGGLLPIPCTGMTTPTQWGDYLTPLLGASPVMHLFNLEQRYLPSLLLCAFSQG